MRLKKLLPVVLTLAALNLCIAPQTAHAENVLEKLFPHVFGKANDGPDVRKTLVAPFANDGTTVTPEAQKDPMSQLTDKNVPIDQAHRSDKEIGMIVSDTITGLFTADAETYEEQKKKFSPYVSPQAIAQYDAFIRSSGILQALQAGTLRLSNYVEAKPIMLGKGVYGGTYRWLYEVPTTLTLIDKDAKDYKEAKAESHSITIRVQVARTTGDQNADSVIIETMDVKKRSRQSLAPP